MRDLLHIAWCSLASLGKRLYRKGMAGQENLIYTRNTNIVFTIYNDLVLSHSVHPWSLQFLSSNMYIKCIACISITLLI